jgi:hypothetical protein
VGAPLDLRREAATLAQRAAEDLDEPTMLGVAAWGAVIEMAAAGAFDLALDELDSVTVPTTTSQSTQLAGMLSLSWSLVAAAIGARPTLTLRWSTPPSWPSELARATPT